MQTKYIVHTSGYVFIRNCSFNIWVYLMNIQKIKTSTYILNPVALEGSTTKRMDDMLVSSGSDNKYM